MKHIGLFEGMGGFSLAAKWMNWETVAWCEWKEFNQQILRYYFPEAEGFGDITKSDFTKYANTIDILTGGFPCQPFSVAGERKGNEDDRYLWKEMLRAIREIQPRWIIGENVSGLINWNRGMVFDEVQTDLENEGYEIVPPIEIPAVSVNANHRRGRIWFIAYSKRFNGISTVLSENFRTETTRQDEEIRSSYRKQFELASDSRTFCSEWVGASKTTLIDDGVSYELDTQAISEEDWIRESLRSAGNAIVPGIAYELFRVIEEIEERLNLKVRGQKINTNSSAA